VCSLGWDLQDAMGVCRQLGYGTAVSALWFAAFGEGTGPIWYHDVNCSGHEAYLTQCGHSGLGVHYCSHRLDAGVTCASE
ncbi:MAG: scavenger receptor cysteine-rich domain-containing protein, partial [Pirellulales bacterium]|nr:scavenger receptor cysteine-rich domain-containing protein [Pirellulales bacterium]